MINWIAYYRELLIKVVPDKKTGDKNIGFVFTKSKAEIAIDKKEADNYSY